MKATMIATGGLSGGISSSIAGGKFWDGFRQGIITSGLNHFGHIVKEGFDRSGYEKLLKQVEKITGQGKATSKFSGRKEDLLRLVNETPILNELFHRNKHGTNVWFKIKNIGKDINNPTKAITTPNGNGGSTIELWWDTADTWVGVAITLGHEIVHTFNESLGMHAMWRSNVDPKYAQDYARANSEAAAYSWEAGFANSGSDYRDFMNRSKQYINQAAAIYKLYGK